MFPHEINVAPAVARALAQLILTYPSAAKHFAVASSNIRLPRIISSRKLTNTKPPHGTMGGGGGRAAAPGPPPLPNVGCQLQGRAEALPPLPPWVQLQGVPAPTATSTPPPHTMATDKANGMPPKTAARVAAGNAVAEQAEPLARLQEVDLHPLRLWCGAQAE